MHQVTTAASVATERNVPPKCDYSNVINYLVVPSDQGQADMPKPWQPEAKNIIYISKGRFLCAGGTAFLERLPCGHVTKTPKPNPFDPPEERMNRRNMRLEAKIYSRIDENPRIPKIIN